MGFWGGGAGAGGWSQGIGGQAQGPRNRGSDGWDDDYLGKVYDAEVIKRLIPYLMEYKGLACLAFASMVIAAVTSFLQPLFIGLSVKAGVEGDTDRVIQLLIIMVVLAGIQLAAQMTQQLTTSYMGNKLLLKLRTQMYDHMQGLSL